MPYKMALRLREVEKFIQPFHYKCTLTALIADPSTGLVFLLHHLADDVMARYATNSGKEEDVKKWPKIEL